MINWMDGPDHYGANTALLTEGVYAQANVDLNVNSGPGGVGTCFGMGGTGKALMKVLPGNRSALGFGARYYFRDSLPSSGGTSFIMDWRDAGNAELCTLEVTPTGALQLINRVSGVTLVTTDPIIVAKSFQHVECFIGFNGGAVRINVNSLPVFSSDAMATPVGPVAIVGTSISNGPNGSAYFNWRDWYMWDTTGDLNNSGMQGDRECILSLVNADGGEQAWAYSMGATGWPLLSNVPPDDAQFVYSDLAGDKSDFGIEPVSTDITSISAIRLVGRAWKSDAGIGTMSLNIRSGATVSASVEQALSTEAIYYSQIVEKDPNTGNKWTPTGLNAALPELERVQ